MRGVHAQGIWSQHQTRCRRIQRYAGMVQELSVIYQDVGMNVGIFGFGKCLFRVTASVPGWEQLPKQPAIVCYFDCETCCLPLLLTTVCHNHLVTFPVLVAQCFVLEKRRLGEGTFLLISSAFGYRCIQLGQRSYSP